MASVGNLIERGVQGIVSSPLYKFATFQALIPRQTGPTTYLHEHTPEGGVITTIDRPGLPPTPPIVEPPPTPPGGHGGGGGSSGGSGGGLPPDIVNPNIGLRITIEPPPSRGGNFGTFTGSVLESVSGLPSTATYYSQGQEIGKLNYSRGGYGESPGILAETKREGKILFNRPGYNEEISFTKAGATITKTTLPELKPSIITPTQSLVKQNVSAPASQIKGLFPGVLPNALREGTIISKYNPVSILTTPFNEKQTRDLTLQDIGNVYATEKFTSIYGIPETRGILGKTIQTIFPKNYGESVLFVGFPSAYTKAPAILRAGISGYLTFKGTEGALNPELSTQERIISGTMGGLGALGVVSETLPFIRGLKSKLSLNYFPVKEQQKGFEAVELDIAKISKSQDNIIGLIPKGFPIRETANVQLPEISPLRRGGFHVSQSEKPLFLGQQTLATSQIGLFKQGVDIPIQREFFTTPQEPFLGIPETRVSRLGLNEGLFNIPKETEIGFGIPGKPQIGLQRNARVGFKETTKQYSLGKGSELEAIKSFGTIKNVQKLGTTTIKGQGVDIYSFDIGKGIKNLKAPLTQTSLEGTRISGESVLASALRTSDVKPTTSNISFEKSLFTTGTTGKGSTNIFTFTTPTTRGTSTTTPLTPFSQPPTTPRTPPTSPPLFPSITTPSIPRTPPMLPPVFPKPGFPGYGKNRKSRLKEVDLFDVFIKRKKGYRPIFTGLTQGEALRLGSEYTLKNLNRTFKIQKTGKTSETFDINFLPSEKLFRSFRVKNKKEISLPFGTYIQRTKALLQTPEEKALFKEARLFSTKKMKGGKRR